MPKGHGSHTLSIEVHVKVKKPAKVTITDGFLREAVERWAETGEPVHGVKITAISWSRDGHEARTASSSNAIEDARANMLRRFLHAGNWTIRKGMG